MPHQGPRPNAPGHGKVKQGHGLQAGRGGWRSNLLELEALQHLPAAGCPLTGSAADLLPLVIVTLVLGYVDSHNRFISSPVKFTLSLLSIMPLSYYIGMAIAR